MVKWNDMADKRGGPAKPKQPPVMLMPQHILARSTITA